MNNFLPNKKALLILMVLLLSTFALAAVGVQPSAAVGTHSATEPTWYYLGTVATSSTPVKMKHVTVVYDPLGLAGVAGNPKFMMIWGTGTSIANQLYSKTSNDGIVWSTDLPCTVGYPSTIVPVYHPEVIYEREGFSLKKSAPAVVVHFKMWFYDAGQEGYNWMRYAESADGISWQVFEGSPHVASGGKNYVEFSAGAGNEVAVLYKKGGTGVIVNGVNQEYVGYQATSVVGITNDGAYFTTVSGQGGGATDVDREIVIASPADTVHYRAWRDFPRTSPDDVTSWDSMSGLNWNSPSPGNAPIIGASWTNFYGAMAVVVAGNSYYMYDTIQLDQNRVGLLIAPLQKPTTAWVDDDWTGPGNSGGHFWLYDAFNTVQAGINSVATGGTVNVAAGTYHERLTIDKPISLLGVQYGVDPTQPGGRTDPASESIIDLAGLGVANPNVLVEIKAGLSNVLIDGFTLIGSPIFHYADEAVVRTWDSHVTIQNNVINGYYGVLYKGGSGGVIVHSNRMAINKTGVTVQPNPASNVEVSCNVILPGSMIAGDPGGIYMTSCSGCKVVGNAATNFADPDAAKSGGRGLAGSNLDHLTVSDNTFTGNKGAISIWGNSAYIDIIDNNLSDSLGPKGYGIEIKGQDITISGNQITNNVGHGIYVARHVIETTRVTISGNNIASNGKYGIYVDVNVDLSEFHVYCNSIEGNAEYGVYNGAAGILDARYNWWGDPTGPHHPTLNPSGLGDRVSDNVQFIPWKTTPEGIVVTIDIKPGSWPNSVNTKAKGVLPVAILSSVGLDATQVDPTTVILLGAPPDKWSREDINGDGKLDLILHFRIESMDFAGLGIGEHEVRLTGMYLEYPFFGTDIIRIVN